MKVIYRPAAAADIDRAYGWYEKERKGLGEEFLAEVRATAQSVQDMPATYPIVLRQTRRALVRRFSYGLFYESSRTRLSSWRVFIQAEIRLCGNGATEVQIGSGG